LAQSGEGPLAHSPEKAGSPLKKISGVTKASAVSLIGQSAPLIVIALTLETTPEWCLAGETRRAEKPFPRFAKESQWETVYVAYEFLRRRPRAGGFVVHERRLRR
jgi:hypothetical protein